MTTTEEMCGETYTRPPKLFPSDGLVPRIPCTFIENHGANHSWFALKISDDVALERLREVQVTLPASVQKLVDAIDRGDHDTYIEILLQRLHDRKRALRGVPGFSRRAG